MRIKLDYSFTWYTNGQRLPADGSGDGDVTFYSPRATRQVAQFHRPVSGQYTVVAANAFGAAKSAGCIEVQSPQIDGALGEVHLGLLRAQHQEELDDGGAQLLGVLGAPPQKRTASTTRTTTTTTVHTTTLVRRSSSVPKSGAGELGALEPSELALMSRSMVEAGGVTVKVRLL